jgi:hypothetical protein
MQGSQLLCKNVVTAEWVLGIIANNNIKSFDGDNNYRPYFLESHRLVKDDK